MKSNTHAVSVARTHEGAPATPRNNPESELRRAALSCLLFEDTFYEKGSDVAARIKSLSGQVSAEKVSALAIEARRVHGLRHVSLFLALSLIGRDGSVAARTIAEVIQRPDELGEALALYWREKRQPIAAALKRGLAWAFQKFDAERLAKYDRDAAVKLRDVMFLVHAKPKNEAQAAAFKALSSRSLAAPDTWEVALSGGADKRETWERLLSEKRLGALALLRNLRNMEQVGVPRASVRAAIGECVPRGVFPWQIVGAAKAASWAEPELETLMFRSLDGRRLPGLTTLLVDVSGSMDQVLSARGERTRLDAASALAMIAREVCEHVSVFTFSHVLAEVAPRRGFALAEAIAKSQPHGGTYLGAAMRALPAVGDRLIVITDEQSADAPAACPAARGYLVNVAGYRATLMLSGQWARIDGWSDRLLDWILAHEA